MPLSRKLLYSLGIPTIFIPGLILAALLGWNWQNDLGKLASQDGLIQNETIFPKSGAVERAIDGDTLELTTGQVVRLIGLQAPERGQSFYRESQKFLENLTQDKKVTLEYEPTDAMDKYGRLVAYVYIPPSADFARLPESTDKTPGVDSVNAEILRAGYAKFLFYSHYRKYKYFDLLQNSETEAKKENRGLWSLPLPTP